MGPRRYFLMARRRRTGTVRQPVDCLAAARRVSGVNTFWTVSGTRAAISRRESVEDEGVPAVELAVSGL